MRLESLDMGAVARPIRGQKINALPEVYRMILFEADIKKLRLSLLLKKVNKE